MELEVKKFIDPTVLLYDENENMIKQVIIDKLNCLRSLLIS